MRKYLLSISISLLALLSCPVHAQRSLTFPDSIGDRVKYNATIEMKKGYISGVCILVNDENMVKGCIFNEFGISAIDFTYQLEQRKVKLVNVIKMLNKWYIKRILKRDLAQVMENLSKGIMNYHDKKYNIDYNFSILKDVAEE